MTARQGNVLYYALGGGLGHLVRTLAILKQTREITDRVRILSSSPLTPLVSGREPYTIDRVPGNCMRSRKQYTAFLHYYIRHHNIRLIILDTFPWGIVGEWRHVARSIPRLLVARSLKWKAYCERVHYADGRLPEHTLAIEPLEPDYRKRLDMGSRVTEIDEPVVYEGNHALHLEKDPDAWLVVHSGDENEQRALLAFAGQKMKALGCGGAPMDTIFPGKDIFPAQHRMPGYGFIVAGAGYNMAAQAAVSRDNHRHFLLPFHRRFDDQHERIRRIESGHWKHPGDNGARKAAMWLERYISRSAAIRSHLY